MKTKTILNFSIIKFAFFFICSFCFFNNVLFAQSVLTNGVNTLTINHPLSLTCTEAGNLSIGSASESWPEPYLEIAYSPINHIAIQANYNVIGWSQAIDYSTKIGIGGYYNFPIITERQKKVSDKLRKVSGAGIIAHIGYHEGVKRFRIHNGSERVLLDKSRINYTGYFTEIGIFWSTALGKIQFNLSNSNKKYKNINLSDITFIDESFWNIVDFANEYNNFNMYSISFRYSLGFKQGSIYYGITKPIESWGNTQFIIEELHNERFNLFPRYLLGITLHIDKIIPQIIWYGKYFSKKKNK